MAEGKVSKTAKKSQGGVKIVVGKRCPGCGEVMVATKVMAGKLPSGTYQEGQVVAVKTRKGMYWICRKCGYRERVNK
jgi:predicted RNA-binding Zn-ribbon protein involved in translation (DUF1610 family)